MSERMSGNESSEKISPDFKKVVDFVEFERILARLSLSGTEPAPEQEAHLNEKQAALPGGWRQAVVEMLEMKAKESPEQK